MKNKKQRKIIFNLVIFALLLSILFLGGMLNILVKDSNGNKMPVLIDISYSKYFNDNDYFSYQNKNNVNYWFLSDIFKGNFLGDIIFNTSGLYRYSFGDILLYMSFNGLLSHLFLLIILGFVNFIEKSMLKNKKEVKQR